MAVFEGAFQNIIDYTGGGTSYYRLEVEIRGERNFYHAPEVNVETQTCSSSCYNSNGNWVQSAYTSITVLGHFTLDAWNGSTEEWDIETTFDADTVVWTSVEYDVGFVGVSEGTYTGGLIGTSVRYYRAETTGASPTWTFGSGSYVDEFYDFLDYVVQSEFGTVCAPDTGLIYLGACTEEERVMRGPENMLPYIPDLTLGGHTYRVVGATSHSSGIDPIGTTRVHLLLQRV